MANRYWVSATDATWAAGDWAAESGGAGGETAPGTGDVAYFDGVLPNILLNAGFEIAGAGGADVFQSWGDVAGDGTIERISNTVHGGSFAAKLTGGATPIVSPAVTQAKAVVAEAEMKISFWVYGDGTNQGRLSLYDVSNGAYLTGYTLKANGVTASEWTYVEYVFDIPAGCVSLYIQFVGPNVNGGWVIYDDTRLQYTAGTCTLDGAVSSGGILQTSGTLDLDAYTITGDDGADFIFSGDELDCGSGGLSITNGDFDYRELTTLTGGTGTIAFSGSCNWYSSDANVPDVTVNEEATVTVTPATDNYTTNVLGDMAVNGTILIAAPQNYHVFASKTDGGSGDLVIGESGDIQTPGTGAMLALYHPTDGKGIRGNGVSGDVIAYDPYSDGLIEANTYTGAFTIAANSIADGEGRRTWKPAAGTWRFRGGLTFRTNYDNKPLTIDLYNAPTIITKSLDFYSADADRNISLENTSGSEAIIRTKSMTNSIATGSEITIGPDVSIVFEEGFTGASGIESGVGT